MSERLLDTYNRYFEVFPWVDLDGAKLDQVYRLRFQVYCVEHPFEQPIEHPDGLEVDNLDQYSLHSLLVHRTSGWPAGTVRMILGDHLSDVDAMPMAQACAVQGINASRLFPVGRSAEISRFAVPKEFRRRQGEQASPSGAVEETPARAEEERRMVPHITLGLIQALVQQSEEHNIDYWCALMEPALLRLLARIGIHFEHVGTLVDFHGRRQPCYRKLDELLAQVKQERPDVWEVITNDGRYQFVSH